MATMYLSIERFQLTSSWKATYLEDAVGGELKYSYPTERQAIKVFNASAIPAGSVIQQAILTVDGVEGKGGGYLKANGSTDLVQDVTALFQASQEGKFADFGVTFTYRAYGNTGALGSHTSTAVIRSAAIAVTYAAGDGEAFDPDAYRTAALAPARDIQPRGIIAYPDGSTQPIDGRHILRFEINEGYDQGILLGTAAGAVLEMDLANAGGEWLPGGSMRGNRPIYGAKITMEIGLKVNEEYVYTPAGTYVIDEVSGIEGDPAISVQGYDEMCNTLETPFTDGLKYPATLSQILQEIVTQAGMGVFGVLMCNRVAQIPKTPDWGEEITLRKALSFVCAAGGSYAYITRDGMIGIADAWKQTPALSLTTNDYMKLSQDERTFTFNRIVVKPRNAKKESENIHAALDSSMEELHSNTLYIDDNPLFVKGQAVATTMANGLRDALQGASWQALDVRWRGDPSVTVGTRVTLTDRRGSVIHSSVMAQSMGWDNGFYSSSRCKINIKEINKTALTGGGMIDTKKIAVESILGAYLVNQAITEEKLADGSIKKAHIQQATIDELNTESLKAVSAEIERLAAEEVTTDALYAALATIASAQITAANIDKANIDWAEIATLNAKIAEIAKAQITAANIEEANIQWAEIESLSAQMAAVAKAQITTANIREAEIGWAEITSLSAVIADIATARIQNADIDFAHIKDLAADTAIITKGVGGELYISRLAVTEANMVSLSVGQLLVKGEDGGFYALTVDESGNVTTQRKQVGNDDIGNLSINAGEKLIEGSVTAATLNVQDIFADSAIIRQLIAANIDVSTLFAREATIQQLNAVDISGNEYLKLSVKKAVDDIQVGGRNLLKNSKGDFRLYPANTGAAGDNFATYLFPFKPTKWETYTFGADVEITDGNFDKISVYPYPSYYEKLTNVPIPENGRITHTFTADVDTITQIYVYAGVAGETRGNGVIFRNVKIEKGNKPTDWTAAPEELETRVTEAEAELVVQAGEIAAKAEKSTVDSLTNRITEAEAELAVQAGEIALKVSQTEFNNLSVGGTNILPGYAGEQTTTRFLSIYVRDILAAHVGKEICISFECKASVSRSIHIYAYQNSGVSIRDGFYFTPSTTEFTRHSFVTTAYDWGQIEGYSKGDLAFYDYTGDQSYTIRKVKIELGNKPTDWSPSPDDPVASVKNTAMTLNGDGIEMNTTGYFRLYANDGKNSRIKLGGDDSSANFSVDETGAVGAVSGAFSEGLTVGNYPVWTRRNIIISSNEPTGVHDVIWIQPMQGVQQTSHSHLNTSQDFFGSSAIAYTLTPDSSDILSSGGSYAYSLSLLMTLGEDTTTVKSFTVSAVISTSAGSVTLTGEAVQLSGWKTAQVTLAATSSVNLCASSGDITANITVDGPGTGNTYMYIPKNTNLILTSKNTAASSAGAQTCTIHYIQ